VAQLNDAERKALELGLELHQRMTQHTQNLFDQIDEGKRQEVSAYYHALNEVMDLLAQMSGYVGLRTEAGQLIVQAHQVIQEALYYYTDFKGPMLNTGYWYKPVEERS
jgi:hypothetical protein